MLYFPLVLATHQCLCVYAKFTLLRRLQLVVVMLTSPVLICCFFLYMNDSLKDLITYNATYNMQHTYGKIKLQNLGILESVTNP